MRPARRAPSAWRSPPASRPRRPCDDSRGEERLMSIALPTLDRSDLRDVARTTRVAMSVSLVVHALLLLWLVLTKAAPRVQDSLTEVTLLDANEAAASAAAGGATGAPAAASVRVAEPGGERSGKHTPELQPH